MKKLLFAVLGTMLFASCAFGQTINITPTGIGTIKIGMNINKLPKSVENLYDRIEVVTTPESYNEMDDETIPAYDTYYFMLGSEKMFHTVPLENGTIDYLVATSKKLSYKGIYPGMSCRELIASNKAKLVVSGYYGSCEFFCNFAVTDPNIEIYFPINNGGSFSKQGQDKLLNDIATDSGNRELKLGAADFLEDAKITEIQIREVWLL